MIPARAMTRRRLAGSARSRHTASHPLRVRAAFLSLGTAALACTSVSAPTVPQSATLAESRQRQEWITERLRAMRAAPARDAGGGAIRRELEQAGVDWRSFLTPMRGSEREIGGLYGEWVKDQTLRQIAQKLNLVRDLRQVLRISDRANDLAHDGRVLDSAFFTNRDVGSISPDEIRQDAEAHAPRGTISITKRKGEGTSEGFWGEDEKGDSYIFILDPKGFPELSTSAEVIGSTVERLAGYYVPYSSIVTLDDLRLDPEAARTGKVDESDLEQFRGRRAVATLAVTKGYRGPWTTWVFRDRREIRALKVFAAWLDNPDQEDHNTLAELYDEKAGLLRYYVIDFSSALGASSAKVKKPQDGWVNKTLDVNRGMGFPLRVVERGFGRRDPWDPNQPIVSPAVGRFDANLDPRRWKPFYPNLAFEDMDEEDARWAARIVRQFSDPLIESIVALAEYSRPEDSAYLVQTLERRRDIVVHAYLGSGKGGLEHRGTARP